MRLHETRPAATLTDMTLTLSTSTVDQLAEIVDALRDWQHEESPFQLHPGDVGWNWQFGAEKVAAGTYSWRDGDRIVAVGMIDDEDGPGLIRLTVAPDVLHDAGVAEQIASDLDDPESGVLSAGAVSIEAPTGARIHEALFERGWERAEEWTPLSFNLAQPVEAIALRIEEVSADRVEDRIAVHRSAFDSNRFSTHHWDAMVSGVPSQDACHLVGYDNADQPVAMASVWAAGPGKPGILEPLGVHQDHRGQGYGSDIVLAAAAALREMGATSAQVATPSANTGAVAAYLSAGFERLPTRYDTARPA